MHVVEGREAKANRRGVSRWSLGARSCASTSLWRGLVVAIGWASVLAAPSWPQGLDADAARSGSGALANLSHTPEANLFVGGVSTSIPIEVPPNRGGMTPQVALTYSSGAGPSLYGYGWDLLLGRIQRRTICGW